MAIFNPNINSERGKRDYKMFIISAYFTNTDYKILLANRLNKISTDIIDADQIYSGKGSGRKH